MEYTSKNAAKKPSIYRPPCLLPFPKRRERKEQKKKNMAWESLHKGSRKLMEILCNPLYSFKYIKRCVAPPLSSLSSLSCVSFAAVVVDVAAILVDISRCCYSDARLIHFGYLHSFLRPAKYKSA